MEAARVDLLRRTPSPNPRPLALTRTSPSDHRRLPGLVPGYLSPDNPMGLPTRTLTDSGEFVFDPKGEVDRGRADQQCR